MLPLGWLCKAKRWKYVVIHLLPLVPGNLVNIQRAAPIQVRECGQPSTGSSASGALCLQRPSGHRQTLPGQSHVPMCQSAVSSAAGSP